MCERVCASVHSTVTEDLRAPTAPHQGSRRRIVPGLKEQHWKGVGRGAGLRCGWGQKQSMPPGPVGRARGALRSIRRCANRALIAR